VPVSFDESEWVMKNVLLICAACALLATGAVAEDNTGGAAEQSGVQRGDEWSYNLTDDVTGDPKATYTYVVSDIDDKVIVTRVTKIGQDGWTGSATYDVHWNLIDDNSWKRKPHDGTGINGPLKVGSEWRSTWTTQNSKAGIVTRNTAKSKVAGEEEVTTQAGTFATVKIIIETRYTDTADQSRPRTSTITMWYAPAVNRWVKRSVITKVRGHTTDQSTLELVDYSRRQ
jgi:hypothetical protein